MKRFCNVVMIVTALAVILSTLIVGIRTRRMINKRPDPNARILHKVFVGTMGCEGDDYFVYTSKFYECYNPNTNDGHQNNDVYDKALTWDETGRPSGYSRTFFLSTDGTCRRLQGDIEESTGFGGCSGKRSGDYQISEEMSLTYADA